MKKNQAIALGVGVAVATAALLGGMAVHNSRGAADDRMESAATQAGDSSSSNTLDEYMKQIREFDKAKADLLDSLDFYQGTTTIQETYSAVSGVSGDTPVNGSVAMVSEDIMAYDPDTDKCYLMARRLSLLGDSVKDFEFANVFSGTAMVKVGGILTEYYGNGVLQVHGIEDALAGKKGYYLNFSANPVRMDCGKEIIYTNPPVKDTYWVQVIGATDVTMTATGIFTPEELPSVDAGLVPGLSAILGEKTYNASETMIYEYTGGKIIPKGTLSYDYKKFTYAGIKDFLVELRLEAQGDPLLDDISATLSEPWQDTVSAAHDLNTLRDASSNMKTYVEVFSGENTADASAAKHEAEMLANGADFQGEIDRAADALDGLESEGGTLRQLEGFSLDGGGKGDRQEAADAMDSLLTLLKPYLAQYRSLLIALREQTDELRDGMSAKNPSEAEIELILQKIRTQTDEIEQKGACLESMSSDIYSVLLSYQASEGKNESEYAALARLCGLWEAVLGDSSSETAPVVDIVDGVSIPDDYPDHVVPLLKNAVAAIYQEEADGTISLTLKTSMAMEEVNAYYTTALKDSSNFTALNIGGMATISGEGEGYEWSILVTANLLGGSEITMVQITLVPAG